MPVAGLLEVYLDPGVLLTAEQPGRPPSRRSRPSSHRASSRGRRRAVPREPSQDDQGRASASCTQGFRTGYGQQREPRKTATQGRRTSTGTLLPARSLAVTGAPWIDPLPGRSAVLFLPRPRRLARKPGPASSARSPADRRRARPGRRRIEHEVVGLAREAIPAGLHAAELGVAKRKVERVREPVLARRPRSWSRSPPRPGGARGPPGRADFPSSSSRRLRALERELDAAPVSPVASSTPHDAQAIALRSRRCVREQVHARRIEQYRASPRGGSPSVSTSRKPAAGRA